MTQNVVSLTKSTLMVNISIYLVTVFFPYLLNKESFVGKEEAIFHLNCFERVVSLIKKILEGPLKKSFEGEV